MKTVELTEDEIQSIITCIEDSMSQLIDPDLSNARHKLFMSLMDSPVSGDTKFIEDGKQYQFIREELIKKRNECLGPKIFDSDGAIILSHAIRWLSFKIEGKPYERTPD